METSGQLIVDEIRASVATLRYTDVYIVGLERRRRQRRDAESSARNTRGASASVRFIATRRAIVDP